MRLKDKVAIVTGAGGGLGRAIAEGYAREGAAVVVNDIDGARAADTVRAIASAGGRAIAAPADIADLSTHGLLIVAALERLGGLDILVNNAGVEYRAPFLEATVEQWDQTFAVNLRAPFFLSQQFARTLVAAKTPGRIVNIGSIHDRVALRTASVYCTAKGGVGMLTRAAALELADAGITVNTLAPGAIRTALNEAVLRDPAYEARVLQKIPIGRIGQPADIVGAAVFLASAESGYMTGATIYIDGGILLQ